MNYLGDFPTGATIYVPFHTFSSDDPSASVTITGLAVTDIEVYKDGSTTQRASDNGYALLDTDGIDFDSITGLHGFKIDTSDNSDSGFYAAGHEYQVALSAITVDGATISFWAASFSIERAGGVLARLKANTVSEDVDYRVIAKGSSEQNIEFVIRKTDGSPYTGLTYDTSGLSVYYYLQNDTNETAISLVTTTLGVWDEGSFILVDDTNMPGLVSLGIPDAVLESTSGVDRATIVLKGAANMKQKTIHIDLVNTISAEASTGYVTLSTQALSDVDDTIDGNASVVAILADTNELQSDDYPTSIAAVQSTVDGIGTAVGNLNDISESGVRDAVGLASADLDDQLAALPTAAENRSEMDSNSTQLADIVEDTGTTLPGLIASASVPQLLVSTTIATLASQTSFTLTAGSADDNAYKGCMIIVTDQSTATQKAIGMCSSYTGSSKTVTLGVDPGIFTMAQDDVVDVIAVDVNTRYINSARVVGDGNGTRWDGA